jgi:hypothetical protein
VATERTVLVRLRADVSDFQRGMIAARTAVQGLTKDIDQSNDRTVWLAQSITALAPAVVSMGAAAIPALAGLTMQLGATVAAAGVAALAFNGVGDGLKALNDYQLKPTEENLVKMNQAFAKLGEDGVAFVQFLDKAGEELAVLGMDARAGMFPGLTKGIEDFLELAPRLRPIITDIAGALGQLGADAGAGLAGEGFRDFFEWLDDRAGKILLDLGRTVGNFFEGFVNLLIAFDDPAARFSGGLREMSESFSEWSQGLEDNDSFQNFIDYIDQVTPKVMDLLGSLVDFGVALAQAAAPIGEVMVPALTALLDLFTAIVATPIGPVLIGAAAAIGLYGRAVALMALISGGAVGSLVKTSAAVTGVKSAMTAGIPSMKNFGLAAAGTLYSTQTLTTAMNSQSKAASSGAKSIAAAKDSVGQFGRSIGPVAGAVGLMAISMSDLDDQAGLTNTTMGAMFGMLAGGGPGAALGAFAGYLLDASHANDELVDSTQAAIAAIEAQDAAAAKAAQRALERDIIDMQNIDDPKEALGQLMDMDFGKLFSEGPTIGAARNGMVEFTGAGQEALEAQRKLDGALSDTDGWVAQEEAAIDAAAAVDEFIASFSRLNNLLANKQSLIDYNRSLRELQDRLKDRRGKENFFDINTEEGSKDMEAFIGLVDKAIGRAEGLREQGKKTAAQKMLTQALGDIQDLNLKGPQAQAQIRRIIAELERLDNKHAKPDVDVNTAPAMSNIAALEARLNRIADEDVFINVRQIGRTPGGDFGPTGAADGWTVPKTGMPYADRWPALLADGEQVISNRYGQADRFREDMASGRIPRYADGGTAWWNTPWGNNTPPKATSTAGAFPSFQDWWKDNRPEREKDDLKPAREKLIKALDGFSLTFDMAARKIDKEIDAFRQAVRRGGGEWTEALGRQAQEVRQSAREYARLNERLAAQQESLAELQSAYDAMAADRASLEESVAGQFNTSITGSGLAGGYRALQGDIAGRTAMDASLATLVSMGLDPNSALYRELAESNDTRTASQLAAGGPEEVANFAALYAERERLNTEAARAQGELVFGPGMRALGEDIAEQTRTVERIAAAAQEERRELKKEIRDMRQEAKTVVPEKTGKEVGKEINTAVSAGRTSGKNR